jgi:hypothetical protein
MAVLRDMTMTPLHLPMDIWARAATLMFYSDDAELREWAMKIATVLGLVGGDDTPPAAS